MHRVMREVFFHFAVKLRSQSFIVRHDDRRTFKLLNDIGGGKGFARAGHAQQCLVHQAVFDTFAQLFNRLGLVSGRLIIGHQFKFFTH